MAEELDITRIPEHIAIIMDGNGRWAMERNKPQIGRASCRERV